MRITAGESWVNWRGDGGRGGSVTVAGGQEGVAVRLLVLLATQYKGTSYRYILRTRKGLGRGMTARSVVSEKNL